MGGKKGGPLGPDVSNAGSAIGKAINSNIATKAINASLSGLPGAAASVLQGKDPTKNTPLDPKDPGGVKAGKKTLAGEGAKLVPSPQPMLAPISSPVTQDQINTSQGGVTNSLASQQALINALAQQNNFVNQSDVYGGMNAYQQSLTNAGGLAKQQVAGQGLQDVYGRQAATADTLGNISKGIGPNPAMAALNQRTGENVANQAALMAGQRGAGANVGLMARQAAQQGGNLQQQAVGQGATMQAQQSLNALGQMGTQQSQMAATQSALGNLGTTQVGAGQTALGAQAAQANTQAANQIGANNQAVQGNIQNVGQQLGAAGNFNQAATANQASVNTANSAIHQQGLKNKGDILGGVLNGVGAAGIAAFGGPAAAAVAAPMAAESVDDLSGNISQSSQQANPIDAAPPTTMMAAEGGEVDPQVAQAAPTPTSGMSSWGSFMKNLSNPASQDSKLQQGSSKATQGLMTALSVAAMAQGGLAAQGGGVSAGSPAQAATVPGNSYANDKINAVLSEGEVVIPRSIMMGKDPVRGAADFVAKILAKKGRK